MSQNVPLLAVLVLLCAVSLAWSEEPHTSNVPHMSSSYQGAGTRGMQDKNTQSSFTNSLPVYSISNRQNAYGSAPETFHDFQSNHRRELPQIPSHIVRQSQMTSLPHGISPSEIDGINPPGINPALRVSSSNQMIPPQAATEQSVSSDPPLSVRGDPLNQIPIYVIRPPYSGMANIPTIVNLAMLPQEQINPEIIRILQSLRLSQDRVPLVLVTGQYPSLAVDGQNNGESGINTADFGDSPDGRHKPIMGMHAPHTISSEEWYDGEIMKHETSIHGRRPASYPNIGRLAQLAPQLDDIPGSPPLGYWLPDPEVEKKIVPKNTERFVTPRGRDVPVGFLPSQQNTTLPRMMMQQDYYPPTKDQAPISFSDSQMYQPIPQTETPEYPTQHPRFPRLLTPNLQQKPGYISRDDSRDNNLRRQYLTHPYSDVQETPHFPRISPNPSQQHLYSGPYDNQAPHNLQTPSAEFPSSDGRVPSILDRNEMAGYPYTIPKQFYPGQHTEYPFIQKVPQNQLKQPSYPYPLHAEFSDLAPQHKYPEYPSRGSEDVGSYPDTHPVYKSQSPHFPPNSTPPSGNFPHPLQQYPLINKHLPIQTRPNMQGQIEQFTIPDIQVRLPPDSYAQLPSGRQNVPSDYHSLFPNRYDTYRKPYTYPSSRQVPISHPSLPTSMRDDDKPNLQSTPDIMSKIEKIKVPEKHPVAQVEFLPFNKGWPPAPSPDRVSRQPFPQQQPQHPFESPLEGYEVPQEGLQSPLTGKDESPSSINTVEIPSDQQLEFSPDDQLSRYPIRDNSSFTDRGPSMVPRREVVTNIEEFSIPEKRLPSLQQKYPQYSSPVTEMLTTHPERIPEQPHQHGKFRSNGREIGYLKQSSDEEKRPIRPLVDIDTGIQKITVTEPNVLKPQRKYPHFPSGGYDGPTNYPGVGSQKPQNEPHPHSRYDDQITHYPREPMDDTEPLVDATEVVSEKFSLLQQGYPTPLQKYSHAPSSDFDKPTYYPDAAHTQPHRRSNQNFPYDDQVTEYPRYPMNDTEPQMVHGTEVVKQTEKLGIPEPLNPKPRHQKHSHAPSSDTNAPTFYPDSGSRLPYKGAHPDSRYDQVTDYSKHPINDTDPLSEAGTEVVSNVEKFSVPERGYPTPLQKYTKAPSSDFDEPTLYPDTAHIRQTSTGNDPGFPYDDQIINYPQQPMDNSKPQMKPRTDVVSKIAEFIIPEQPYTNQLHPQAPSPDTKEPKYYPDSGPRQLDREAHSTLPSHQDKYYLKHPINDEEPQMRSRPDVSSNIEPFSMPEHIMTQHEYPRLPSSYTKEPEYDLKSNPRQPYKGTQPDFQSDEQYKGYQMDDIEPLLRFEPDAVSTIEKLRIPNLPFQKSQQKYPLIPSSDTIPPYGGQHPDFPSHSQDASYPKTLADGREPKLKPIIPAIISNMEKFNIPEQPHMFPQQTSRRFSSSDTREPTVNPPGSNTLNYPDFPAYGQVPAGFPKQPLESSEQSMKPHPVFVSKLNKFNILEEPDIMLRQRYPQNLPSVTDDTRKYPDRVPDLYTGHTPEVPSDGQNTHYQKYPYHLEEPSLRPRPETVSEFKEFHTPDQYHSKSQEGYPQYPSSDADEPIYQVGQPYDKYPESDDRVLGYSKWPFESSEQMVNPQPEIVSDISKFKSPEDSMPIKKHPEYPLTGRDASQMFSNKDLKPSFSREQPWFPYDGKAEGRRHQQQPSTRFENSHIQPKPDVPLQVERIYITERPLSEPKEEYSSLNEPSLTRPITGPQMIRPDLPKSSVTGFEPQHPGIKQHRFDNQQTQQIPKFPADIPVPTDQAQQFFSQYPSSNVKGIRGRPDIISQYEVLKIPKTPDLRIQQKYPHYLSSDTENPLHHLNTYPEQVPSEQQQPSSFESFIHHPFEHSPQIPPINDRTPSFLPVPDFTANIGRMSIPEQGQGGNIFPLPEPPIRQPLSGVYTNGLPNQINAQYPSTDDQIQFSDSPQSLFASTPYPVKPRTSDRGVEPEEQSSHKNDPISRTLDMIANVQRFKIPEQPPFIPPGQENPQYLPTDATLLQPETQGVPDSDLRQSNDININIERLTLPGQMKWQPGQRYPEYDFSDTQKPDEYPVNYSLYPDHKPQTRMKPHYLNVDGERLPKNADRQGSSSPYVPLEHPPFPYAPKGLPQRNYQEMHFLPNHPQPLVTIDLEPVSRPDHSNMLPMHEYPQHRSAGDEPPLGFKSYYGSQYPPEKQVSRDHNSFPSIYSLDDQGFPKKQLKPDIQLRMERFEVTEPASLTPADESSQNPYTTSSSTTTQKPQYYDSPYYPQQQYPDSLPSRISIPNDQTETEITLPIGRQVQSLPYYKKLSDSTTINPPRSLDIIEGKSHSEVRIEKIKQQPPVSGYNFPVIGISPVVQPHQDQLAQPHFIEPKAYGTDQYPDSQYPLSLRYPGTSRVPHLTPQNTWDGNSPDGRRQPSVGQPTVHLDGAKPIYYPLDQTNYPYHLTPTHPSLGSSPVAGKKHLKKPTVYVYPVIKQQEVPQLERSLSEPQQSEPFSYYPETLEYQAPIDDQTSVHPQPSPYYGTSPKNVLQYDLQQPREADDFPKHKERSIQGTRKPPESTTHLPSTVERHELEHQTSIDGYGDEQSPKPSIQTQYTTPLYTESMPSQSDVSLFSPAVTMFHPQPSTEKGDPLDPNKHIPHGSAFEGMPDESIVRLGPDGGAPQVPQSPQDIPRTELPNGQESSPDRVQPAEEPSSSVNTLEFPYPTEGVVELNRPVNSGATTLPPGELQRGFYPDEALTTTGQTTGAESASDEPSIFPPTLIPQVVPTGNQLQREPSSGVTGLPNQLPTSIEPFPISVPPDSPRIPSTNPSLLPDSKITRIFPVTKPTFYTDKDGQKFVSLKLLNENISTSPTGDIIPRELTNSSQHPGTTDLVIPIGRDVSDSLPQNVTQPHPMLKGIPISNVQVFDAQKIIKIIESCNCSNLKFLIPILKRPQSAIVVANSEYPEIAN